MGRKARTRHASSTHDMIVSSFSPTRGRRVPLTLLSALLTARERRLTCLAVELDGAMPLPLPPSL